MPSRVSPTEKIRADIDALFASERDMAEVLEDVARLGAPLLLQTALEAEVTEFLGRARYAHGDRARLGSRNGRHPTTIKTTAGPVEMAPPEAARHRRTVRVTAARQARDAHARVGVAGHRRLRPGAVDA